MKLDFLPWAVAPALVAPLLVLEPQGNASGLVRVEPQSSARASEEAAAWKARLQDHDLAARERAFDDFVNALRRDEGLRRAARDWRDASESDLAWTARLALREADRDSAGGLRRTPLGGGGFWRDDLHARLDDMQRQFGDLDQMFEDLQRRFHQGFQAPQVAPSPGRAFQESQSYSLQVTPDGVKVEVQENVDGKLDTKTYEAKTLDELYAAHPELKDKLGPRVEIQSGPRAWWGSPEGDEFFGLRPLAPGDRRGAITPLPLSEFRTDRLGVLIDTRFDDAARSNLKLDPGVGLKVSGVQPNSIASKVGIVEGDVLVELNGKVLHGADDVRATLESRRADEDVAITLIDTDGKRRTLTWRAPTEGPRRL